MDNIVGFFAILIPFVVIASAAYGRWQERKETTQAVRASSGGEETLCRLRRIEEAVMMLRTELATTSGTSRSS